MKVIYITGSGRSGSTVMDIVLGSHPEIISVGELTNMVSSGWTKGEYCACGKKVNECAFWCDVMKEWTKLGGTGPAEYVRLQSSFERFRHFPRLIRERSDPSQEFISYSEQTSALFSAIGTVSGKSVIVDSSKNPCRALALSAVPGIDLRLVHLIRDGRGVIWSYMKAHLKDEKKGVQADLSPVPSWKTTMEWLLVNSASAFVLSKQKDRGRTIRYEDFAEKPESALNAIGEMAGIDLAQTGKDLIKGKPISVKHTVAGNMVRMTGSIRLKPDYSWKESLPDFDRKLFWLLAGKFARRYGYRT